MLKKLFELILVFNILILVGCQTKESVESTIPVVTETVDVEVTASTVVEDIVETSEPVVEKVYEIDEGEINPDIKDIVDANPDLIFHNYSINGIPTLEVYKNNNEECPVIFMLHGLDGYKEGNAYLMAMIAKNGYRAVSVDNVVHGERSEGECYFFEVIEKTVPDVEMVISYYVNQGMIKDDNFAVGGFSMGGMISYMIGAYSIYNPKMIIGISSLGDFTSLFDSYLSETIVNGGRDYQDKRAYEINMEIANRINPANNIEGFVGQKVLMYHSYDDKVLKYDKEYSFYEALSNKNVEVEMISCDNMGHTISHEFMKVLPERLNEVFK